MDEQDNINFDNIPEYNSGVEEAVSEPKGDSQEPQKVSGLTLEQINGLLGKSFPDLDTAQKSIKDTYNYVGKKVEAVDTSKFVSKGDYEKDMFYAKNPEYDSQPIREYIEAVSATKGIALKDVVEAESFKELYGGFKSHGESQKLKSVLGTNPRIASSMDSLQNAQKAMSAGNTAEATKLAVKAVMGTLEQQ